jgi:CRP-like cAMP-binding protein
MQSTGGERDKRDKRDKRDQGGEEGVGITAGIAREDRARLVAKFGRTFAAGETLFREGEPAKEAFLVQEGRVRLVKRVRMVERALMVVRPGELFGESALHDANPRSSTAIALTDGAVLAFTRDTFRALLESHPSVAMRVIDQLTVRVRDAEDQIEIMMLRDTQSKIVSALLKLARDAVDAGVSPNAELSVTPVELSSRVGLDVETVRRTVQRLREQGYLKITSEKVELPDLGSLRALYALLGTKEELASGRG